MFLLASPFIKDTVPKKETRCGNVNNSLTIKNNNMETQETWQEKTSTLEKIEEFKAATEGMSSKKKEKAFLRTFKGEYFIKKDDPKRPSATLFGIYGIPKDKNVAEISNGIFTFNGI